MWKSLDDAHTPSFIGLQNRSWNLVQSVSGVGTRTGGMESVWCAFWPTFERIVWANVFALAFVVCMSCGWHLFRKTKIQRKLKKENVHRESKVHSNARISYAEPKYAAIDCDNSSRESFHQANRIISVNKNSVHPKAMKQLCCVQQVVAQAQ